MDATRFILVTSLCIVTMLLWQAWIEDYGVVPEATTPISSKPTDPGLQEIPDISTAGTPEDAFKSPEQQSGIPENNVQEEIIRVETDVFQVQISLRGGGVKQVKLTEYPVSIDAPDEPFVLLDESPSLVYIIQGGLLSSQTSPTHENRYTVDRAEFRLSEHEDAIEVPLIWRSGDGIKITKIFRFERGNYLINVRYQVENNTNEPWQARTYTQIKRNDPGRSSAFGTYTYTGTVISSPESRYEKVSFDDMQEQKLKRDIANGWAAMLQHYFVTALIPVDKEGTYHYYSMALADNQYIIGSISPGKIVGPSEQGVFEERLYIGPKIQKALKEVAEGLELTVDYGMLWFIAKYLFWGLSKLYDYTGNWGWAIILVTVILKLIFYPLSAAGYRSMANMRRVQPRIMSMRERYKNDKARLNQAMMQIYKEEKINPFGGCLPILVQIPIFIALYWVLLESVEMRQANFIFWLRDLSSADPYFVLPVLMGITMFIQQKLNPAPMDPIQEKVMMTLPFVFTVFFAFFPSGLVLYWVVNNILSIIQQWRITRTLERAGLNLKPPSS